MTRDEFLARCANAYDAGLARDEVLRLLERWAELVARLEGGQLHIVIDLLSQENERTNWFRQNLSGDKDGYDVIQLAAILTHPCQLCATSPNAWWTRSGMCSHREE